MLLLLPGKKLHFIMTQYRMFHEILPQFFLLGALVKQQGLQLPASNEIQTYGLFSKATSPSSKTENEIHISFFEPPPPLCDVAEVRALASLP